ncbi:Transmembrane protease, serine 9 [Heterocephalus glaber]|uniref:Transmembrane protease, serine 9 n=1 Tax=Heterocephalus glaber TaxID=10181 RepID=G5BZC0_HETGA|nr:Transmembrane protease, serine 9 [Heterocephalus glaber]
MSLLGIGGSPVKLELQRVMLHPRYNPGTLDFDVAVLELAKSPARLPPAGHPEVPSGLQVHDLGLGQHTGREWASVGIVDQKTCRVLYNFSLTDRMLCAGFLEGRVDSCQVLAPNLIFNLVANLG